MSSKGTSRRSKNNELRGILNRKNTIRAFLSSLILVVAIPIFLLVVQFSGIYGGSAYAMKVWLAVFEVFHISMAAFGLFILKNNDIDWEKDYYRIDFAGTLLGLFVFSGFDRMHSGSSLFYSMTALYFIMVPILCDGEKLFFQVAAAVGFVMSAVLSHGSGRIVFDNVMMSVAVFFLSNILHEHVSRSESNSIRLRAKTISSEKDPLTGLTNRRGLERKVNVIWPYCERTNTLLGMIELDIDFFKKYNDRFGHPAGDKCLKMVAKAIKESAKRNTDIAARTGGEEFIIFVQGMDEKELIEFAMTVRSNIARLKIPHAYAGVSQYVTVSMGVAVVTPSTDSSVDDLYEMADKALYQAKGNGRNCIVCNNGVYGRMKNGLGTVIG